MHRPEQADRADEHAYASFVQYRPHELLNREASFFIADEDVPRLGEYSRRRNHLEAAPKQYEFLARRKKGGLVRIDANVTTCRVRDRVLITAVARPAASPIEDDHPADRSPARVRRLDVLSPRELEIMEMILAGIRVKEIALHLDIDAKTVATHRSRMMKKLDLTDSRSLFQFAIRHQLVDWR